MKLSASIYSHDIQDVLQLVYELEPFGIDYWHIDTIENHGVMADIKILKEKSETEIDLHIITKDPEPFIHLLRSADIARVSFQIEELESNFRFPEVKNTNIGLAIKIANPNLETLIEHYRDEIDFVLLMMTTPGVSGGKFNKDHFQLIQRMVHRFPEISWCVDGGVTHEVSYILRLIGIQSIVVGSYLTGHENMARAIMNIQSRKVKSNYVVEDFMLLPDALPVIHTGTSVLDMLQTMHSGRLGVVFVIDDEGKLEGIISNADIRNVLLSGSFDYTISVQTFINRNPKKIKNTFSTSEMIEFLDRIKFPILVLPIVSENEEFQGAISFHKLLKED